MKKEQRFYNVADFRAVASEEDKTPRITGYAAVFNEWSDDLGGFREKIKPGAFKNVLDNDVRALFNHNENFVLGRIESGTLKLNENTRGLGVDIEPPGTQWANDLLVSINRGDINQMSFAFTVEEDKWETKDEENFRTVNKVAELFDVSVVSYPAYPQTSVKVRELFQSEGLDYDAIARILIRHERDLEISSDDHVIIRAVMNTLWKINGMENMSFCNNISLGGNSHGTLTAGTIVPSNNGSIWTDNVVKTETPEEEPSDTQGSEDDTQGRVIAFRNRAARLREIRLG